MVSAFSRMDYSVREFFCECIFPGGVRFRKRGFPGSENKKARNITHVIIIIIIYGRNGSFLTWLATSRGKSRSTVISASPRGHEFYSK